MLRNSALHANNDEGIVRLVYREQILEVVYWLQQIINRSVFFAFRRSGNAGSPRLVGPKIAEPN